MLAIWVHRCPHARPCRWSRCRSALVLRSMRSLRIDLRNRFCFPGRHFRLQCSGSLALSEVVMSNKFDRFTKKARQVLTYAQEEAQLMNHGYIGTEHLLLGLVREQTGIPAKILHDLGVDLQKTREIV